MVQRFLCSNYILMYPPSVISAMIPLHSMNTFGYSDISLLAALYVGKASLVVATIQVTPKHVTTKVS